MDTPDDAFDFSQFINEHTAPDTVMPPQPSTDAPGGLGEPCSFGQPPLDLGFFELDEEMPQIGLHGFDSSDGDPTGHEFMPAACETIPRAYEKEQDPLQSIPNMQDRHVFNIFPLHGWPQMLQQDLPVHAPFSELSSLNDYISNKGHHKQEASIPTSDEPQCSPSKGETTCVVNASTQPDSLQPLKDPSQSQPRSASQTIMQSSCIDKESQPPKHKRSRMPMQPSGYGCFALGPQAPNKWSEDQKRNKREVMRADGACPLCQVARIQCDGISPCKQCLALPLPAGRFPRSICHLRGKKWRKMQSSTVKLGDTSFQPEAVVQLLKNCRRAGAELVRVITKKIGQHQKAIHRDRECIRRGYAHVKMNDKSIEQTEDEIRKMDEAFDALVKRVKEPFSSRREGGKEKEESAASQEHLAKEQENNMCRGTSISLPRDCEIEVSEADAFPVCTRHNFKEFLANFDKETREYYGKLEAKIAERKRRIGQDRKIIAKLEKRIDWHQQAVEVLRKRIAGCKM